MEKKASSSALMTLVIRAASFSDIGAMGVSPSFCCSMARWMMMVVGKKEAAPATANSTIFVQKIGLPVGLGWARRVSHACDGRN